MTTKYEQILAIHDQMTEMEREAQRTLSAQKMAAGDDTHNFRVSLVDFCMWDHGIDREEAVDRVNHYLNEQKGRHFLRRSMRRKRKI